MLDGNGRLVDVACFFAQLNIVQRLDFKGGRPGIVAEALQLVGVVLQSGVVLKLFPLVFKANLLQQADMAYLLEPFLQQHVLQLQVLLVLLAGEIGLVQRAAFEAEFIDAPAGPTSRRPRRCRS